MPVKQAQRNYFADFDLYTHMAHFVGKILHIRPNEILDAWGVPELIVAYGQYANEIADENYKQWKAVHTPSKGTPPPPPKYAVRFIGLKEMQEWTTE